MCVWIPVGCVAKARLRRLRESDYDARARKTSTEKTKLSINLHKSPQISPHRYDTDGTMATLLELERESPEAMLEPEQLAQVKLQDPHSTATLHTLDHTTTQHSNTSALYPPL